MHDKLADRVIQTSDDKSFKLQIQNVHESDSGIYIARAMNGDGQATCTAQLVVQERKFAQRFVIDTVSFYLKGYRLIIIT